MEDRKGLHLGRGLSREWVGSGRPVGITNAPTHFGTVSYEIRYESDKQQISGYMVFPEHSPLEWVHLHMRLPYGLRVHSIHSGTTAAILNNHSEIQWKQPKGRIVLVVNLEEC